MAVKDCYTDYQTADYNNKYDLLKDRVEIAHTLIDTDRFGDNLVDPVDPLEFVPDVSEVKTMTFRYKTYKTSNANQRDTLRYGLLDSAQQYQMWGFETYQEFRDHLARRDKARVTEAWEELKCEIAGTHARCLFWLPKNDQGLTRPGCWAITVDQSKSRFALVWANQDYYMFNPIKLSKQNLIRIVNV
jgi:hypothetical protein